MAHWQDGGNSGRLIENVDNRRTIFPFHRHEHPRHEREVEIHVRLVAVAEIGDRVFRPLVRLGKQHLVVVVTIHMCAQAPQESVRLRQILAIGTFSLVQVGHGVEPQTIDAHSKPKVEHVDHRGADLGIVEIQIWLVAIKPVPEVCPGDRVPTPIRCLEVLKDNPSFWIFFRRIAPDIQIAPRRARRARRDRWNHSC